MVVIAIPTIKNSQMELGESPRDYLLQSDSRTVIGVRKWCREVDGLYVRRMITSAFCDVVPGWERRAKHAGKRL